MTTLKHIASAPNCDFARFDRLGTGETRGAGLLEAPRSRRGRDSLRTMAVMAVRCFAVIAICTQATDCFYCLCSSVILSQPS